MNDLNTALAEKYTDRFLKEVMDNVEAGESVKMCIQCGACAGACPLGSHWQHSPQKILMMIFTNQREAVLSSDSMWMCTSCYQCTTHCPRQLPVTHIIHGLASYAKRLGLAPQKQPTARFAQLMWDNLTRAGRVNELKLAASHYFSEGFSQGVKTAKANQTIGLAMLKSQRMAIAQTWGGHQISDKSGFQAMLKKAEAIEQEQLQTNSQSKAQTDD